MSALDKAIELADGLSALSRGIGAKPSQVGNWRSRRVPTEYCPLIERFLKGKVRCEDLRPDVDWSVLRKSSKSSKSLS